MCLLRISIGLVKKWNARKKIGVVFATSAKELNELKTFTKAQALGVKEFLNSALCIQKYKLLQSLHIFEFLNRKDLEKHLEFL